MRRWLIVVGALSLLALANSARAQEDCENCKDLSYLPRLPNYHLTAADEAEFDAYKFPDGKTLHTVEGRYFRRDYSLNEGATRASPLQIRRNYATAFKKASATILFDGNCNGAGCEPWDGWDFVSGHFKQGGKETWVLMTVNDAPGTAYSLYVIERAEMKQDIVLNADGMQGAIQDTGRVALQINFDSNKATIKADSESLLDEVAKLLENNGDWKLRIEGHTDNTGDAKLAKKLSEERAKSVVTALVKRGVTKSRLSAKGWGSEKPVADNGTPEGQAKNRRVELVKVD